MPEAPALLLVDDMADNLLALEAALAPLGHPMVLARSGEDALRHLLLDGDFAAVVLDVQMPGLDGFETAVAIRERERNREVPILFLTAINREESHRLRGFALGAVDYIFKPVDPEVLRAKVAVFVRLYASERELRRQQEELRRRAAELARSNAELDQFASVVSHDLLDPLNVISGYLELLSDRLGAGVDAQTREWMERMDSCAARMGRLIEDLLSYSRAIGEASQQRASAATSSLDDALADALANLRETLQTADARVDTPETMPPVAGSRRELAQVFQNLIANSLRHSGGRPVRVEVTAGRQGDLVDVRVTDDGPGVPAHRLETVFAMFEKAEGAPAPSTGLGLAICRKIIHRLGGRIWMEPNDGAGVSVVFQVPAAEGAAAQ